MEQEESKIIIIKEKESPHGVIQLRSDNILVFRPNLGTFKEYNLQILKDLHKDFLEITDGIPRPYMCDNRHIAGLISQEEKEYIYAHSGDFATEFAIITSSSIMKIMVNTFNAMFKPKKEVKLFNTEKEAVKWLTSSSK